MPLRDHFHPPISLDKPWEGFHGLWASMLVQFVTPHLPHQYFAMPNVRFGGGFEVDMAAFQNRRPSVDPTAGEGGTATAVWAPPKPHVDVTTELTEADTFEVLVFDESERRRLVAAVEIVSPSNKDRPENRRAFIGKCANLVRQRVSVSIIDVVTVRPFNLYADLLDFMGHSDPQWEPGSSPLCAVTLRTWQQGPEQSLKVWAYPLGVTGSLPTLPIWLTDDLSVPLELEPAYEATCRTVRLI